MNTRKQIRLQNYDYSNNGAYFETICTKDKKPTLCKIVGDGINTLANELIPKLISSFKRFTNKKAGVDLWQRSFYDHVIHDEKDYQTRLEYIENNPLKWEFDDYYFEQKDKSFITDICDAENEINLYSRTKKIVK